MTEAEKIFWDAIRGRRLHSLKFRRQQVIDGFIVDFYCDKLSLCVEIDGAIHDLYSQEEWDSERDAALSRRGIRILRIKNDELMPNFDKIKDMIGKVK